MKIVATADWHLRPTRPISRTDENYKMVCYDKAEWILNFAMENNAIVCHGGDVFNSAKVPQTFLNMYLDLFSRYPPMVVATGNHDQSFHRLNTESTAIGSFRSAKFFLDGFVISNGDRIATVDWGAEGPAEGKVLIIHKTITPKSNSIIEGSVSALEFMKSCKFPIIISGDYHVPFVKKVDGQLLVNPGSMMRQSIDQINMEPVIYLIDTDTLEFRKVRIPVKGGDEVFDLEAINRAKESKMQSEKMQESIAKMAEEMKQEQTRPSFFASLSGLVKARNPNQKVKAIVAEVAEQLEA